MSKRRVHAGEQASNEGRQLRYEKVYELVLSLIDEKDMRPGDKLPSTQELADLAQVSLISVRRALDELQHAGRIERHQGVGTFVARKRFRSEPTRPGELLETLADGGSVSELETRLLSIDVGLPSENFARTLGIERGQPVWDVRRVRRLGDLPRIVEQAVMPLNLIPALDEQGLAAGGSLYRYLEDKYSLNDEYAEQSFEVDLPEEWEREQLDLGDDEVIVRIRGVSFDSSGIAFDCYQQSYRARDFVFYSAGYRNQTLLRHADVGEWSVSPLGGQYR